jgi:hypothetical protein
LAALLKPVVLMSYVLGAWKLASDLKVTDKFELEGIFSHWQTWFGVGVALQLASFVLNRYGMGGELRLPTMFSLSSPEPAGPPAVEEELPGSRSKAVGA